MFVERKMRSNYMSSTIKCKSQSFGQSIQNNFKSKLTLKEDIKYLLRCLIDKKKSIAEEENQQNLLSMSNI